MLTDQPTALTDRALDTAKLIGYLRDNVSGIDGDIEVLQFPGGHSNLTYLAKAGPREFVIKRAPPGPKAKSAHDMGREYAVLSKLPAHFPYAPHAYAYCEDESILGSGFCVMERLTGVIVRRAYDADVPPAIIRAQFFGLIDALADLHAVDVTAAGLGGLGRPEGYAKRQVEGWIKRMDAAKTDDQADFAEVTTWLMAHLPAEATRASVVHNDFKLDNLVWHEDDIAKLRGVLDWEMSTIGDPLMDLACTLSFWLQKDDPAELQSIRAMPTLSPGAPTRAEAIARYETRTGARIADINFYTTFGYFRRAVIEQQKYARYVRGQTDDARFATLQDAIVVLRDVCQDTLGRR